MGLFIAGTALGGRLASLDVFGLIWDAGPIVKLVLLILALMSVISWAIIAYKWRELGRAIQDSEAFLEVYHEESMSASYDAAHQLDRGPLSAIFLAGCSEMSRLAKRSGQPAAGQIDPQRLTTITKRLSWTAERESHRLERGLSFLATTGSAAPFIGLFGSVIGIIQAFQGNARAGSASLAVVAPGIAEALIATAAGLLAAIPATIFYNVFVARVTEVRSSVDRFEQEFEEDLTRMSKEPGRPAAWASGE